MFHLALSPPFVCAHTCHTHMFTLNTHAHAHALDHATNAKCHDSSVVMSALLVFVGEGMAAFCRKAAAAAPFFGKM
jgi:hypothetical protein